MDKFKKIRNASLLGVIGNLFLLIIKMIVAVMFGSSAMLADSFNSAGDIFSSIMTFIGNKISSKPIDEDHDLGHGKAEYVFSLIISVIMILFGFMLIKDTILNIIDKNNLVFSKWLIIVCIITIITKFLLFLYTNYLSKKFHNILIKANSKDHLNDVFVTLTNMIAILLSTINIKYIDQIAGIIISLWIIYAYFKILIESYHVLMDRSISLEQKEEVIKIINKYPEIVKYNHFNATPIGYEYQISISIFVDGNLSTFKSHEIADNLEKDIVNNIDNIYLAVIHVNPIKKENK